jgi:hypothetical protein
MMKHYDIQAGGAMVKETIGDLAVITPRRGRGAASAIAKPVTANPLRS